MTSSWSNLARKWPLHRATWLKWPLHEATWLKWPLHEATLVKWRFDEATWLNSLTWVSVHDHTNMKKPRLNSTQHYGSHPFVLCSTVLQCASASAAVPTRLGFFPPLLMQIVGWTWRLDLKAGPGLARCPSKDLIRIIVYVIVYIIVHIIVRIKYTVCFSYSPASRWGGNKDFPSPPKLLNHPKKYCLF